MQNFLIGLGVGIFGGGALSYLYAQVVISDAKEAILYAKVEFDSLNAKLKSALDALAKKV